MSWSPERRAAEHMRKLNADPEFAARAAERMRDLHADPAARGLTQCRRCGRWGYRKTFAFETAGPICLRGCNK
ncbi:MAG: hypothetical protein KGL39_09195 [Patescibacteria group bacterium]|nr:hypothetical protein [Patescibacteria group bacterium]